MAKKLDEKSLRTFIQVSGMQNELIQALCEKVLDNGGDLSHFQRFWTDRKFQAQIARQAIGGLWEWVGKIVDLNINWQASLDELDKEAKDQVHPGIFDKARFNCEIFPDPKPRRACKYTLHHFGEPVSIQQARDYPYHAGYRELVHFAMSQNLPKPCKIVALASDVSAKEMYPHGKDTFNHCIFLTGEIKENGIVGGTIRATDEHRDVNYPRITWMRINKPKQKFPPDIFFLFRIEE